MAEAADGVGTRAIASEPVAAEPAQLPHGHLLQYRFSTQMFGRRFYMAILAGAENRSPRRVHDDGTRRNVVAVAAELAVICLALSMMICLLIGVAVVAMYLVKVAMGFDVFEGPSPLHPIYEFMFGG
jgi:hypothetical protein